MAISSFGIYLMKGTAASDTISWAKLVDIKDFPDIGGAPEMLDTTTLSDDTETRINGIKKTGDSEFTVNYTKEDYDKLKLLEGIEGDYAVWFGVNATGQPDGSKGKYQGKGIPTVTVKGTGVNTVVEMKVSMAMSKPFAPSKD